MAQTQFTTGSKIIAQAFPSQVLDLVSKGSSWGEEQGELSRSPDAEAWRLPHVATKEFAMWLAQMEMCYKYETQARFPR